MIDLIYTLLFAFPFIAFFSYGILYLKEQTIHEILLLLISFSASILTGSALIHLLLNSE